MSKKIKPQKNVSKKIKPKKSLNCVKNKMLSKLRRDGYIILEGANLYKLRKVADERCGGGEWGDASDLVGWGCNAELEGILGELWPGGHHMTTWCIRIAQPGCKGGGWHVDYPTHDYEEPYPAELHGIQVVVAIDDFTLGNGATEIIPGSHESRRYPVTKEAAKLVKERVLMKSGSIAVWDSRLWHRTKANKTAKGRRSFVGAYSSVSVPLKDGGV